MADEDLSREESTKGDTTFRVSAKTSVQALGGAIFNAVIENRRTEMRCVGPGPINQAIKATVHAAQLLAGRGKCIVLKPSMRCEKNENVNGVAPEREEVTIVLLRVFCIHEEGVNI